MNALGVGILQSENVPATRGSATRTYFDTEPQGKPSWGWSTIRTVLRQPPRLLGAKSSMRVPRFARWNRSSITGAGGFVEKSVTHPPLWDLRYHDQPGQFDAELGWQRHDRVVYEWILPLKGPTVYSDHGQARRRVPPHRLRGRGPRRGSGALERPRVPLRPGRRVG